MDDGGDGAVAGDGSASTLLTTDSFKSRTNWGMGMGMGMDMDGYSELSPEDIGWLDSCLLKEPDDDDDDDHGVSDIGDWSSLADALLDAVVLSLQQQPPPESTDGSGSPPLNDIEMSCFSSVELGTGPSGEGFGSVVADSETNVGDFMEEESGISASLLLEGNPSVVTLGDGFLSSYKGGNGKRRDSKAGIVRSPGGTADDSGATVEEIESKDDGFVAKETEVGGVSSSGLFDDVLSGVNVKGAFLPNYNEEDDQRVVEPLDNDSGLFDLGVSETWLEPLTDDIFTVWDLGGVAAEDDEGDELTELLNKALSDRVVEFTPSTRHYSDAWKDAEVESLDDVIAGIKDLSIGESHFS